MPTRRAGARNDQRRRDYITESGAELTSWSVETSLDETITASGTLGTGNCTYDVIWGEHACGESAVQRRYVSAGQLLAEL